MLFWQWSKWRRGIGTWYLVVCQDCTKWSPQRKTEKLHVLLLHVANMQLKRENGRPLCRSQRQRGDTSPRMTRKFSHHSQHNRAERCAVGEGQLHQASVALQLWLWLFSTLRLNEIYNSFLVDSTHGHNMAGVTSTERQLTCDCYCHCLLHIQCRSVPQKFALLLQRHSALSIPVWKVADWAGVWRGSFVTNQGFLHL